jgi:hypothetical protein
MPAICHGLSLVFSPDADASATVVSVFPPSSAAAELPSPNSRQQRDVLMASQPQFLAACTAGIEAARRAQCADGTGNTNSTAVRSWGRFTTYGLRTHMQRTEVRPDSPWIQRMAEVDIVESWAWWLVTQVGVAPSTAKDYMHTANAWHERWVGYGLGAGLPLTRVSKMLDGLARLQGAPPPRRLRIGVRPKHLRQAIDAGLDTRDPLNANYATAFEVCLVAIARAGEIASGLPRGAFDVLRHPSRADLTFEYDRAGNPISATIMIVNSKARGIEARRKVPVVLPMHGTYLSPGYRLWLLDRSIDPVPDTLRAITPLFRDPATNTIITVDGLRASLRAILSNIGRDGSTYGAHSLRIGGATAMAFCQASAEVIKDVGRWNSDAYLRYIRECRGDYMSYMTRICSADVDDMEADHLDLDAHDLDDSDYE